MTTQREARPIVVGLVRCSTDEQEHSVDDQEAEIRSYAASVEAVIPEHGMFEDEGVSGSELDRPGLLRLLNYLESASEKGTLVVWHRDRLARPDDPREGIILEYKIEKLGWKIHYLHGASPTGNVLVDVLTGAIEHHASGDFLRKLSRDTLRGQLHRVLAGEVPGCKTPYGYLKVILDSHGRELRRIKRTEPYHKSKRDRALWEPGDPDEIQVVHRIFYEYVDLRYGFARIAKGLNQGRIVGPEGGAWTGGTIRDLLLNPAYVGDLVWNKETTAKFSRLIDKTPTKADTSHPSRRTGKRILYAANKPADWITVKKHHPPLVERSVFERAGEIMREKAKRQGSGRTDYTYPLSGLLFCTACSSTMNGRNKTVGKGHHYRIYHCAGHAKARVCKPYWVGADRLQTAVLRKLRENYATAARSLGEELRERILAILRRNVGPAVSADGTKLAQERRRLDGRIRTAINNMGEVSASVARQLGEQIEEWRGRVSEIDGQLAVAAHQTTLEQDIARTADEIVGLLRSLDRAVEEDSLDDQKAFFRRTVERIDARFVTETPTNGRKKNRHTFVGATVKANTLLAVASRALASTENSLGLTRTSRDLARLRASGTEAAAKGLGAHRREPRTGASGQDGPLAPVTRLAMLMPLRAAHAPLRARLVVLRRPLNKEPPVYSIAPDGTPRAPSMRKGRVVRLFRMSEAVMRETGFKA
jgi:DNA invertase Pin-like site-specific DNA recombinase